MTVSEAPHLGPVEAKDSVPVNGVALWVGAGAEVPPLVAVAVAEGVTAGVDAETEPAGVADNETTEPDVDAAETATATADRLKIVLTTDFIVD